MENQFIGHLSGKLEKKIQFHVLWRILELSYFSNYVYVSGHGNAEQRIGKQNSILSVLVVCI